MPSQQCPKCGLHSPAIAERCDCGYEFASGQMKTSYLATPGLVDERLVGIRGWLILPAIGIGFSPLFLLVELAQSWPSASQTSRGVGLILMPEAGLIVLSIVTLVAFFGRRRSAPWLFVGFLGAQAAFTVTLAAMVQTADSVQPAIRSVTYGVIWALYFLGSKRVKATFVR